MKCFPPESPPGNTPPASSRSGYALVFIIALLAILAAIAGALVPDLVRQSMRVRARDEGGKMRRLTEGLRSSIERTGVVPGTNGWVGAISAATGWNTTEVAQVFAEFPTDANTRRVYLIHPSLTPASGSGRLPYTQTATGLVAGSTNAPTEDSRVMIVSNVRREMTLPVGSGIPSSAQFNAIWDWHLNPATKAPPSGWPAAWNGKGDALHVGRLSLTNVFHTLTLEDLLFSINGSAPPETVSNQERRLFLRGSLLSLFDPGGMPYAGFVIDKDASFRLRPPPPLLFYRMNEASGTTATNLGTYGSAANGTYTNGPTLAQAGPRSPTFSGFPTNNNAVLFDGSNDYMDTTQQLPGIIRGFTLAGWIYPTANLGSNKGMFGQRDSVYLESKNANFIRVFVQGGANVEASWSNPKNAWYHIAATGNGSTLRLYVNGSEVASNIQAISNYGNPSSTYPFRIGGLISTFNDYSDMRIDEVLFYTHALSASGIQELYTNSIPYYIP